MKKSTALYIAIISSLLFIVACKKNKPPITIPHPPTVTAISPATGIVNTVVTITGTNFKTNPTDNTVKFNGVSAIVQTAATGSLTVLAPASATGIVSVATSDGTGNGPVFTYIPSPTITSINPTSGPAGTTVTITGTNFDATALNNSVKFNGVIATVTSAITTQLVVTAPPTGTTGNITVTTSGGTSNAMLYTYTIGPDIYMPGLSTSGGNAGYWKNNSFIALTNCAYAHSVFISGTDIYVSGSDISSKPAYWKNGTAFSLPTSAGVTAGIGMQIIVSGSDVYVAGYEGTFLSAAPKLWKNGLNQILTTPVTGGSQIALGLAISGSYVYVAGASQSSLASGHQSATVWKNGTPIYLPNGDYCTLTSVFISGSDMYACGQDNTTSISTGRYYWKNNNAIPLAVPGTGYECTGIGLTANGDVYISGHYGINPQYWKNGTMNTLTPAPPSSTYATGLFVTGNDVYISGNYGNGGIEGSGYWKNGTWNSVPNAQSLNGIFVK